MEANGDCTCDLCVKACKSRPGWPKPGEMGQIAAHLGLTFNDLFLGYLAIDWWEEGDGLPHIDVLAPAADDIPAGGMYPESLSDTPAFFSLFVGAVMFHRCVFLDDEDKCSIHPVKPFECRENFGCGDKDCQEAHRLAAEAWNTDEGRELVAKAQEIMRTGGERCRPSSLSERVPSRTP